LVGITASEWASTTLTGLNITALIARTIVVAVARLWFTTEKANITCIYVANIIYICSFHTLWPGRNGCFGVIGGSWSWLPHAVVHVYGRIIPATRIFTVWIFTSDIAHTTLHSYSASWNLVVVST